MQVYRSFVCRQGRICRVAGLVGGGGGEGGGGYIMELGLIISHVTRFKDYASAKNVTPVHICKTNCKITWSNIFVVDNVHCIVSLALGKDLARRLTQKLISYYVTEQKCCTGWSGSNCEIRKISFYIFLTIVLFSIYS